MNAKVGLDLYRLSLPFLGKTMIVGTNSINSGGKTFFGFSSSYNSSLTQHLDLITIQTNKRETDIRYMLTKDNKDELITESRAKIMADNI